MADTQEFVYYFSDPDSTDKLLHCLPITLPVKLNTLPWHWHTEKPDESLKDPVWSISAQDFVENDNTNQAAILAQANEKIKELNDAKDALDKDIKAVQSAQSAGMQQSQMVTKQMGQMMKMMQTMQSTLATLGKSLSAKPSAENGGNK